MVAQQQQGRAGSGGHGLESGVCHGAVIMPGKYGARIFGRPAKGLRAR
jgi:hypothetical protein